MLNDRGSIKWVSLMLPEHVKALRQWKEEVQNDWQAPVIDENKFEEMNRLITQATETNSPLIFTIQNHNHPTKMNGRIQWIDEVNKRLKIEVNSQTTTYIQLSNIIDIQSME